MNKINKKVIKQIKSGNHDVLMEALEFLLDSYNEDVFELGYQSCLEDMTVHSGRIAKQIVNSVVKPNKPEDIEEKKLEKVIDEYFKNLT